MCQKCGYRCSICGWHPDEPLVKPEPEGADPIGDGPGRWACRYCSQEFDTAAEVRDHQEARHRVGSRLVTDAREWWEAGG